MNSLKRTSDNDKSEVDFCRLLREIQAGEASIKALLDHPTFRIRLLSIVMTFSRSALDVDVLAKKVRHGVRRKLHRFEPDYTKPYGNFFPWLVTLTRKGFLDSLQSLPLGWESAVALLEKMQTPESKRGIQAAYEASPEKLGLTAVKHAQKRRNLPVASSTTSLIAAPTRKVLRRAKSLPAKAANIDLESEFLQREFEESFKRYAGDLPEKHRLAVAYFLDALPVKEIATKLRERGIDCSDVTISGWLMDALKGFFIARKVDRKASRVSTTSGLLRKPDLRKPA